MPDSVKLYQVQQVVQLDNVLEPKPTLYQPNALELIESQYPPHLPELKKRISCVS